jgi:hypothetical protein
LLIRLAARSTCFLIYTFRGWPQPLLSPDLLPEVKVITVSRSNDPPPTITVDALFARLHDERGSAPPQQQGDGPESHTIPSDQGGGIGMQPPPPLESPADLQIAHEWLQAETARLEAYTRNQFAAIQQQHQALLAKQFRSEEALALRAQELNREMKFLGSQSEDLQNRARELAEREAALGAHMERLANAEQEILSNPIREDAGAHRTLLERLRADAAQLQAAGADAHTDAAAWEAALKERQQAWEHNHATLVARQVAMEQRYATLEKAEAASQRRLAELDEVEQLLRTEFEQQERRLALDREEIAILRARLRTQISKLEAGLDEQEEDAVPV